MNWEGDFIKNITKNDIKQWQCDKRIQSYNYYYQKPKQETKSNKDFDHEETILQDIIDCEIKAHT